MPGSITNSEKPAEELSVGTTRGLSITMQNSTRTHTDRSRASWNAALRLAALISGVSAAVAATLSTVGGISDTALVLSVIVIGFAASWVQSGRIYRDDPSRQMATVVLRRDAA